MKESIYETNKVRSTKKFAKLYSSLLLYCSPLDHRHIEKPSFGVESTATTGRCADVVTCAPVHKKHPHLTIEANLGSVARYKPLLKLMLRSSRTSSMGLLDGLNSLQGAPPPSQSASNPPSTAKPDAFSQFSNGARSFFGDVSDSLAPAVDNVTETAKTSMSSLRRLMGEEEDIEAPAQMSLSEEMSTMFNLTMFQRIGLFAMCFGTGVLMIVLSFSFLPMIVLVPHKFAASFTLGNVLAIMSTWVLVGPRAQLQSMFHPVRAVAAGVYVFSLVFALFAAFLGGKFRYVLVLAAVVAEIASRKLPIAVTVIRVL